MSAQLRDAAHRPSSDAIAALLNAQGFLACHWGSPRGNTHPSATLARALPVAGEVVGTDGRTYTGIVLAEQFNTATHPDLVDAAAYSIRRKWEQERHQLGVWLSTAYGYTLRESTTVVEQLPMGVVRTLLKQPGLRLCLTERDPLIAIARHQAERAFEAYDFADLIADDAGSWECDSVPGSDWTRVVYVRGDDAEEATSKIWLTVRFTEELEVQEIYAIDRSGNFVGKPGN